MTAIDVELRQADLLQYSSDLISVVDRNGTVTYHSPSVERILGYDGEELVGEDALEYVHPDDRETLTDTFLESRSRPSNADPIEHRFRHADGSWVWLETAVTNHPCSTDRYVVNSRDVTERKRATRARRAILNRMTDAFIALDTDWRFTYVNDRAKTLLESEGEDLRGREIWDAFPEAVETEIFDRYHEAMDAQRTVSFECYYDPFDVIFEIRAFPSDSGLSVYFRDVTEHRRLSEELRRSVDALNELYDIASDPGLFFETKRSRILELGRRRLDLPYAFVTRIADGEQTILTSRSDHELLQPGESCPLERSYCRKTIDTDGILAVFDAEREGWSGDPGYETFDLGCYVGGRIVVDGELWGTLCFAATEPRSTEFADSAWTFVELASKWLSYELEQRRYQAELERQNERLEQFASVVSHDLRNPLSIADGKLEVARAAHDDADLEEAATALERAFTLIDQVLTFARMGQQVVDRELVYLPTIVADAWEIAGTEAATLTVNDALEFVDCNRERLSGSSRTSFGTRSPTAAIRSPSASGRSGSRRLLRRGRRARTPAGRRRRHLRVRLHLAGGGDRIRPRDRQGGRGRARLGRRGRRGRGRRRPV